jgi:hypothetical protein
MNHDRIGIPACEIPGEEFPHAGSSYYLLWPCFRINIIEPAAGGGIPIDIPAVTWARIKDKTRDEQGFYHEIKF